MTLHGHRAAVLGHPIAHSLSPILHRAAYAHLGLDWTYEAIDVGAGDLRGFVLSCGPEWVGLSLTMPLKHAVLPLLEEAEETVGLVGAANTLVWRDGRRVGANTDVAGFVAGLREGGLGPSVEHASILGAGATAAAALAALAELGVGDVRVYARRPDAASALRRLAARLGLTLTVAPWTEASSALDAPLVLSTVPAGGADLLAAYVDHPAGLLFDVVYASWPTPLARAWSDAGGEVTSGLDLLVHQAVGQIELMTGRRVPVDVLRKALT